MIRNRVERGRLLLALMITALAVAPGTAARAADDSAGRPGEWLAEYASARTLGLGNAFVATADDPFGVLWNPAGLSSMYQNELRFETAQLFEDTAIHGVSFAVPGSWLPSFGVTMLSLRSGEFQKTNELNDDLGTFHEGETAYLLTVSRGIGTRYAVGANIKLIQQTVEDFNAQGFGVDLGGTVSLTPAVRIGASVANLAGPTLKLRDVEETYPAQVRGGVAATVLNGRGLVALEVDNSEGVGARFHAGGEYWIQPALALRVGYGGENGSGGFTYRFAPQYQLDYAVADHDLGLTHRAGLSYRFGGFFASSHAEPEVFSPTGERAVTRIELNARTKAEPETWSLDILNKSDEVVRRFGGSGQPPAHLQWDGKDEAGMPLADGVYRYTLVVKDHEGRRVTSHTRTVEISTTGPQVTVPVLPVQP